MAALVRLDCPACGTEISVPLKSVQISRETSVVTIDSDAIRDHITKDCSQELLTTIAPVVDLRTGTEV